MEKTPPRNISEKRPSSSKWRARLWMIPPIILVLVAIHQFRLVNQFHLNPSKGGAFRMFSTVDHYTSRSLRAHAIVNGQEYPVLMNDWLGSRHKMVSMSSEYRLQNESRFLIGEKFQLIEPNTYTELAAISTSDPRGQKAYEQVYLSQDFANKGNLDTDPLFLIVANKEQQSQQDLLDAESINIEARRIVYEGKGRFTSRVVSSAQLNHE